MLTALVSANHVQAQEALPASLTPNRINADRLRWLQYSMVAGRIAITSDNVGTNMTYGPARSDRQRRERLSIQIQPASIVLRYELTADNGSMQLSIDSGNRLAGVASHQFVLHSVRDQTTVHFEQAPGEWLELTVKKGDTRQHWQAPSFWHLLLAQPEPVRAHLIPVLEILRPAWQLAASGAALEDALLLRAAHGRDNPIEQWQRWVAELGSPRFNDRVVAERELLAAGQAVVPFLQALDRRHLDAEQNWRLRKLVEQLSPGYQDGTDRLAVWLADDPQIWLALVNRPELAKRRIAARRLAELSGEAIDFDPGADQVTRAAQYDRLQASLAPAPDRRAPSVPPPGTER